METTVQEINPEALAKTLEQMASSEVIYLPEDPDEEAFVTDDEAMDFPASETIVY